MTRTISLTAAIATTALLASASTAWGQPAPDSFERAAARAVATAPDAFERAIVTRSADVAIEARGIVPPDAFERAATSRTGLRSRPTAVARADVFERAAMAATRHAPATDAFVRGVHSRSVPAPLTLVDHNERLDATPGRVSAASTTASSEMGWSRVGIGTGLVLLLALALGIAVMRLSRMRALAH